MNAAGLVAVEIGVVTAILCRPSGPLDVTAVIVVALTTVKLDAAMPPIVTRLASVKLVPVNVIVVPPLNGPELGTTPVIVGALVR